MAAKTWFAPPKPGTDELLFHNDAVSLCLLVNRRQGTLRVIDFRSGPTLAKRNFILSTAKREGIEKVFTLVERDEVRTWTRLGFAREGSIPGFYKRSDAWIMGAVVSEVASFDARHHEDHEDDEDDEPGGTSLSPAAAQVERTLARAKRLAKDPSPRPVPRISLAPAAEADVRKAIQLATKTGRALTCFEPFGRAADRDALVATARGGFTLHASTERQPCFDNSFFELLTGPANEAERHLTIAAVGALCDRLRREGAVSTFTLCPGDHVELAAALLASGFRRSAILHSHLVVGGVRKHAIVFSRKLLPTEA